MSRQIFSMFVCVMLYVSSIPSVEAQYLREGGYFFLQGRGGLSGYFGDRTSENTQWSLVSYAIDGGLGFNISPHWSIAATYRRAEYPRIRQIPFKEYWFARKHTANLYIRYTFNPNNSLAPYVLAGAGATMWGTYDGFEDRPGYGPIIGAGVDYALSEHFFLFLEATSDIVLDDQAVDGISGSAGFDALGVMAGGLRIFLKPRFRPIEWASITGPTELRTGEQGTYRAAVDDKATKPVEYRWDFGDGTTAQGMGITKIYDEPGQYTVRVTASNPRTQSTESIRVTVIEPPIPAQIVSINYLPAEPRTDERIIFSARVRGTEPINYRWDFGDGTTSREARPSHTYTEAGTYTVSLHVENVNIAGDEGVDKSTVTVTVLEPVPPITELNTVHFDFDKYHLDRKARELLRENVNWIKEAPDYCVQIDGYTDSVGTAQYNLGLSELRAKSVVDFYVSEGIDRARIHSRGLGIHPDPCIEDDPEPGCRINRRAESRLIRCDEMDR